MVVGTFRAKGVLLLLNKNNLDSTLYKLCCILLGNVFKRVPYSQRYLVVGLALWLVSGLALNKYTVVDKAPVCKRSPCIVIHTWAVSLPAR